MLGTPWAFQFLKEITLQKKPDFLFICEIICKQATVEKFQRAVGFGGVMVVEPQGRSGAGGIALLWRNKDDVLLRSYSKSHIDIEVHWKKSSPFRLTGIYGKPDRSKRSETWQLIRNLSVNNILPWVLVGDMNNVCS